MLYLMAQKVPASLPGDTVPLKENLPKISKKVQPPENVPLQNFPAPLISGNGGGVHTLKWLFYWRFLEWKLVILSVLEPFREYY